MAIKVVCTCDNCGTSQEGPHSREIKELYEVRIQWQEFAATYGSVWNTPKTALWCKECLRKVGIRVVYADPPIPEPAPTLEDQIRAIVDDAVANMRKD